MNRVALGRVWVFVFLVIELSAYAGIVLANATELWGQYDPGYENSLVPLISLGFARDQVIQGVFIAGVSIMIVESILFWFWFDDTAVDAETNATEKAIWGITNAVTILIYIFLIAVAGTSFLLYRDVHGGFAITSIILYIIRETLALGRRGYHWIYIKKNRDPFFITVWTVELGELIAYLATFGCFRTGACLGGIPAQPAYEYIFFGFFAVSPAARIMDIGMGTTKHKYRRITQNDSELDGGASKGKPYF